MNDGLTVKKNTLSVLQVQLAPRANKDQYGFVAVGSATDAYIHHEKEWRLTEGMLNLFLHYRFPVFISTKCTLITRDIEILKEIDRTAILPDDLKNKMNRGVILSVSVSTMNEKISNILEPGVAIPLERMQLVKQLKQEGFLVGVNAIPTLPFISDKEEELEKTIAAAKEHRADYILVGGLTLFGNNPADSKMLYYKFLERYDPSLIPKYKKMYDIQYSPNQKYQEELKRKADKLCEKYKIRNRILE
jgi:DNA repair photolyase